MAKVDRITSDPAWATAHAVKTIRATLPITSGTSTIALGATLSRGGDSIAPPSGRPGVISLFCDPGPTVSLFDPDHEKYTGRAVDPKEGKVKPVDLARRLARVRAEVREKPKGPEHRPEATAEGRLFGQMYAARRRAVSPYYEIDNHPEDLTEILKVFKSFDEYKIGRKHWGAYLDLVFEGFAIATQGRCLYPPPNQIWRTGWVDRYVAGLGIRDRNTAQVQRMLRGAGFDCDRCDAAAAIRFADRIRQRRTMPPDIRENTDLWPLIEWLSTRTDQVGYYDDL